MKFLQIPGLLACLVFAGCANPSITSISKSDVAALRSAPIYVPRFEGRPDYVEEATDMFIATLRPRSGRSVIQGDSIRAEGYDVLSGGNLTQREASLIPARKSGAGILILGKVTSHHTGDMINGFTTARIVRVSDGSVIGTIHRDSALLMAFSEHQCVMASAKRAAEATAKALGQ